jgi:hypothetical protein
MKKETFSYCIFLEDMMGMSKDCHLGIKNQSFLKEFGDTPILLAKFLQLQIIIIMSKGLNG